MCCVVTVGRLVDDTHTHTRRLTSNTQTAANDRIRNVNKSVKISLCKNMNEIDGRAVCDVACVCNVHIWPIERRAAERLGVCVCVLNSCIHFIYRLQTIDRVATKHWPAFYLIQEKQKQKRKNCECMRRHYTGDLNLTEWLFEQTMCAHMRWTTLNFNLRFAQRIYLTKSSNVG